MDLWDTFATICGYEVVGDQLRLYLDSPTPTRSYTRERGVRSSLFRLYGGADAQVVLAWLDANKAWQCLRVPPALTRERAARAVVLADNWHGGEASGLLRLARNRMVADNAHCEQLRCEVRLLIGMVLENPVRGGELAELQLIEDVVNTTPAGVELCGTAEVVDAFFGAAGGSLADGA